MRARVLSGMRPTGALHLGHYHGALKNWVQLQHEYECFFFVADWHALTTHYQERDVIERNVYDMVVDWIAAGLDPDLCTLFIQSRIPEHAELFTLLAMGTPLSWLERVPTYKDQIAQLSGPSSERPGDASTEHDLATYGFLGYPLLQAADILIYKAAWVPVGEDQDPHVELTREVARRFNHLYDRGAERPVLVEPQALHTAVTKLPGLDGRKMSKSYGNTIEMREEPAQVEAKIRRMPTDPQRVRRTDAGDPARCTVWQFHQVYSDAATQQWVVQGCTTAGIGCLDCKQPVIDAVLREQQPWRDRAEQYLANPKHVHWIVEMGTERARTVARQTMKDVRDVMGLAY
jgi:tryptophanyl-tRNA synthetase